MKNEDNYCIIKIDKDVIEYLIVLLFVVGVFSGIAYIFFNIGYSYGHSADFYESVNKINNLSCGESFYFIDGEEIVATVYTEDCPDYVILGDNQAHGIISYNESGGIRIG